MTSSTVCVLCSLRSTHLWLRNSFVGLGSTSVYIIGCIKQVILLMEMQCFSVSWEPSLKEIFRQISGLKWLQIDTEPGFEPVTVKSDYYYYVGNVCRCACV